MEISERLQGLQARIQLMAVDASNEVVSDVMYALIDVVGDLAGRVDAGGFAPLPTECRTRQCTYFVHYLAYGPADLTHDGFHAAETRCAAAQEACERYMAAHPDGPFDESAPPFSIANRWERAVRA